MDNIKFLKDFNLEDVEQVIVNMNEPMEIPYIIDGELFQFESKKYLEKIKRYTPKNINGLSIIEGSIIEP